jgi:hypothetical protein
MREPELGKSHEVMEGKLKKDFKISPLATRKSRQKSSGGLVEEEIRT